MSADLCEQRKAVLAVSGKNTASDSMGPSACPASRAEHTERTCNQFSIGYIFKFAWVITVTDASGFAAIRTDFLSEICFRGCLCVSTGRVISGI